MIINKVRKTIKEHKMLSKGDRIVVGISGGPDSVCLLTLLQKLQDEWDIFIHAAYLNHQIRKKEVQQETDFVKKLADRLNIKITIKSFDVPAYRSEEKLSIQEAAREIRYQFLFEVARKEKADKIALGHNADDQAETFLMRLMRGAGVSGLRGIPPVRDGIIIRPLIETTRSEIESFLTDKGIEFIIDSSNFKTVYLRNKIRLELFPLLRKEYNPRLIKVLNNTCQILNEEDDFLCQFSSTALSRVEEKKEKDKIVLALSKFTDNHPAIQRRILRAAIEYIQGNLNRINYQHINDIIKLICSRKPNGEIDLPGGLVVYKEYQSLILVRKKVVDLQNVFKYKMKVPGVTRLSTLNMEVKTQIEDRKKNNYLNKDKNTACLNYDKLKFPLTIRNRKEGDRFYPLGMKGSKKIKDYFIAQKIPLVKRNEIPLLVDQEKILWIMGWRIDERVKITEATRKVLMVNIKYNV